MTATTIQNVIKIDAIQDNGEILIVQVHGEHWDMFESYKQLPACVMFNGRIYAKIAWNSDNGEVYYKPSKMVAAII